MSIVIPPSSNELKCADYTASAFVLLLPNDAGPRQTPTRTMTASDRIPVIDIRRLDADASALSQIHEACRDWGFFQIVGHGVPDELIQAMHASMCAFFALPLDEKRAIERTAANSWGYYDRELTKNTRDWKQVFDVGPDELEGPLAGQRAQWPHALPKFRGVIEAFASACETLSFRMLDAIARCLHTAPEHLRRAFTPRHSSFLRLNYYPLCSEPAAPDAPTGAPGNFGINHHTDSGAITILLQDEAPGLQVFRRDAWTLVEPNPDALVVNIGDIVQVWSNDRYPAALHRVIASDRRERFSAPYFFNPAPDACYAPLPNALDAHEPAHYQAINWGEFRAARTRGDYADYGEEIQISHYRTRARQTN
jgi:isopenicillin N synthase-like dioxygenase